MRHEKGVISCKPMTGYLFIDPEGYKSDADLAFWVEKCMEYNPKVKAKKK